MAAVIADTMALAERTVKNHVSSVLRTQHLQRRTQVAVLAERAKGHRDTGDRVAMPVG